MPSTGTMSWLRLLCLLPLWTETPGEESSFIESSLVGTNVEMYDMLTVRYEIHLDKVSFWEAKQICIGRNGSLLELSEAPVAEFIGQALAESAAARSSLWVGGEYTPSSSTQEGVWKWQSGENIIQEPMPEGFMFPMETPPYWVDRPDLNNTEPACLVTDRCLHDRPLITGLPCTAKRPFICAIVGVLTTGEPKELTPVIMSKTKVFHLFYAEYTWEEAFTTCRGLGYELAVVTKHEEFVKLQNRMRRVRPIIENAWTSGVYLDGKWIWVANNREINTAQNETNKRDNPPWYQPNNITQEGCLLADRHLCDYFVYVEARCDRRRSFICQRDDTEEPPGLRKVPEGNLYVSTIKLSWHDAQAMCKKCLPGGSLFQLAYHDSELLRRQVVWMYQAMTSLSGTEIRHVWLNGYLHGDAFQWSNTDEHEQHDDPNFNYTIREDQFSTGAGSLLGESGEDGFIVFCPGNFKEDPYLRNFKCLNLDRENLKHFFMYGLSCEYKQHFLCIVDDGDGLSYILQDTCRNKRPGIKYEER